MRLLFRFAPLALLILVLALTACDSITGQGDISNLETKNAQLQGTLNVVGTPMMTIAALEAAATQNVLLQVQLSQAQGTALAVNATLTVMQFNGAGGGGPVVQSTQVPVGPIGDQPPGLPTTAPTPGGSDTRFTQTVTSTGTNAEDCPVGVTTAFDKTTPTIYVDTQINFLPNGSTFGARWTANGSLFFDDTKCWTPDKDWYNICAYCSIVPDNIATGFTPGDWTVELLLNGQVLSQAQFTVTDSSATGGTPVPSGGLQ